MLKTINFSLQMVLGRVPLNWSGAITRSNLSFVAKPMFLVKIDSDKYVRPLKTNAKTVYKKLISTKAMTPAGALNWSLELELPDKRIQTGFNFARNCTPDMFRRTFQYKIVTQILPTNEFLHRYLVLESSNCSLCTERDTTLHQLYECNIISNFIACIFSELNTHCNTALSLEGSRDEFVFGLQGSKFKALNQILLELKVFNFYYTRENSQTGNDILKNIFFARIKKIMLREKCIALGKNKFDDFDEKWGNFIHIYDYRGPDVDHIS